MAITEHEQRQTAIERSVALALPVAHDPITPSMQLGVVASCRDYASVHCRLTAERRWRWPTGIQ
jgi:hypothetical protein